MGGIYLCEALMNWSRLCLVVFDMEPKVRTCFYFVTVK